MSAHTPGPWGVVDRHDDSILVCAGSGGAFLVAECYCDNEGDEHSVSEDEMEANARLIANAPGLLAALKRIIREATGHTLASLDEATAAIAKAEGRS